MSAVIRDIANSGYLYPNAQRNNKEDPTHKGKLRVNGAEIEIWGWSRRDTNGCSYLSLQVRVPPQLKLV